ncbi:MAG: flagellar hook-basal body complex protein FliE [Proteobacteria bacterium]|nr:flagellar hook-basal body complex protein FliE [Pseudomonadota bacterium]MDA1355396.1 flagellar hook-basal body complex protein FliE [Pseudomonadota bacterium]
MDIKIANAAAAYASRQLGNSSATNAASSEGAGSAGGDFSNLVKSAVNEAAATTRTSEMVSAQALVNPGDLGSVVTAVTSAEITMQAVIAVRDKVVPAYQDILRMPI